MSLYTPLVITTRKKNMCQRLETPLQCQLLIIQNSYTIENVAIITWFQNMKKLAQIFLTASVMKDA